jgi:hypothetical protein
MSNRKAQPYTGHNPRNYKGYKFEKEGKMSGPYSVKVFDLSEVPIDGTRDLSSNCSENYKTSPYGTTTEAFTQAYGWVNFMLHGKTNPEETEDSWKKTYEELRETHEEFYKSRIPEEKLESHMENDKAWEEKLERAYKAAWG